MTVGYAGERGCRVARRKKRTCIQAIEMRARLAISNPARAAPRLIVAGSGVSSAVSCPLYLVFRSGRCLLSPHQYPYGKSTDGYEGKSCWFGNGVVESNFGKPRLRCVSPIAGNRKLEEPS